MNRIDWIDQIKGFAIFLVVYGHNFPITEKYIYTFHMPLFFIIAGFFHPTHQNNKSITKRFKGIMIPYLLWSFLLFLFWVILGRKFGDSTHYDLSVLKNFIGIFYAQGGREFMDWGIPMWFLPTIFITFILFFYLKKIKNIKLRCFILSIAILLGFTIPHLINVKLVWSLDVALVSLFFYVFGYKSFPYIQRLTSKKTIVLLVLSGIVHFILYPLNTKVDMYRSIYGNEFVFVINGIAGSIFYLLMFKQIIKLKFLSFLGKFTIPILAMQIRALTFIKLILLIILGMHTFNFTEVQKLLLSILQIVLMIPLLYGINTYFPILNGHAKKL